ncbi:hypothetical protein P43SY_008308 [Pythium insidiosum]|uniref:Macro domain-containing protein n=1 Tax=Pythium insidiosum TaxID=114742 RepID=A0AAD5QC66_PYTIN|nr:hypothetical protein P43SY_008308 [Pythium insidiosum]
MALSSATHHVLTDAAQWRHLMLREGLLPRALASEAASADATELTVRCEAPCCPEVAQYLSRLAQRLAFDENVLVVSGDIGTISSVGNGIPVDCLVFPTSAYLRNPHVGAAGCVHARAGSELDRHIADRLGARLPLPVGSTTLTPAFNADIHSLIHCIGPSGMAHNRELLLYTTYINALAAFEKDLTVQCAAIASISTGINQFPIEDAATVAISAVRDMIRSRQWTKVVAFVCVDAELQAALESAKATARITLFHGGYTYPDVITVVPPP